MSEPLVMEGVRRSYRTAAGTLDVLTSVDLTLRAGEICCIWRGCSTRPMGGAC
jgi:hypothetical protein